jgi:predicted membrane chloride channel (bestrophin family)
MQGHSHAHWHQHIYALRGAHHIRTARRVLVTLVRSFAVVNTHTHFFRLVGTLCYQRPNLRGEQRAIRTTLSSSPSLFTSLLSRLRAAAICIPRLLYNYPYY